MRFRFLAAVVLTCTLSLLTWFWTPAAWALTQIPLFDIGYEPCPEELAVGSVTSGGSTMAGSCYLVTGKARNDSGKTVVNADIFGRIYDANHDSVMQNRTRLGAIEEVPPGVSEFAFRITVPASQPTPLQLEQFKAAGFTGKVRR